MTFSLGWDRRDDEGRRINIEFSLVRQKASWRVRRSRNEPREEFAPEEQDWQDLFEVMDRHFARGKVTKPDYDIVRDLHKRQQR